MTLSRQSGSREVVPDPWAIAADLARALVALLDEMQGMPIATDVSVLDRYDEARSKGC
jgi:hypothetical protein